MRAWLNQELLNQQLLNQELELNQAMLMIQAMIHPSASRQ